MAVSTTTNRVSYSCNGSVTDFDFTFPIFQSSDLQVYLRTVATGVEVLLTETTDYSVAPTNNDYENGGTVTTVATYTSAYELLIIREVPLTQQTDYVDGDAFPADSHESALDRLTMIVQQLNELFNRSLVTPKTDDETLDMEIPSSVDRASRFLYFDASGEPTAVQNLAGAIAATAFAETLLDDTDAEEARGTLKVNSNIIYELSGGDYTVLDDDTYRVILVTTGAVDRTITLPTLADNLNRSLIIMKVDAAAGKVIVDGEGAEAINGVTTIDLLGRWDGLHIVAASTEWKVISGNRSFLKEVASDDYAVPDIVDEINILVTTGASARTMTLPTLADNQGKIARIKKVDSGAGTVIVDGEGAETIDGATTITLHAENEMVVLVATSTGWEIVEYHTTHEVKVTDTGARSQATPTQSTWYNPGSLSITIPIGTWLVGYQCICSVAAASGELTVEVTLSTANNSESDAEFTTSGVVDAATDLEMNANRDKILTLAAEDVYYLNIRTVRASMNGIVIDGATGTTVIRAIKLKP